MYAPHSSTKRAFLLYRILWLFMAPLLRFHKRMKIGYRQRILKEPLPKADLWIQAASVGEAYLVEEILLSLAPKSPLNILVTTNTSQGMDILKKIQPADTKTHLHLHYCPFDSPGLLQRAVAMVQPRLVVLIETELWPSFLQACQQKEVKVCVINGRMTEKSMKGYLRMGNFWKDLAPTSILAMNDEDCTRYGKVFGQERTSIMTNIKFDRLLRTSAIPAADKPLSAVVASGVPFVVLGSTRSEEEEVIGKMIESLLRHNPEIVIGLFPRHMERIHVWQQQLDKDNIPFHLRSEITTPVAQSSVILWDTIGELQQGYHRADAAFVGGSLAPLGGQNFLEPLSAGLQPVIGESWSNFYWVGEEIFEQNLVIKAANWQEVVNVLLNCVESPSDKTKVQQTFHQYAKKQQGGTAAACKAITHLLES